MTSAPSRRTSGTGQSPTSGVSLSATGSVVRLGEPALSLSEALRELRTIRGVVDVRLLPRQFRQPPQAHKAFVVIDGHDIERDEEIVRLMCQFDRVDYDIVTESAAELIPDAAASI